MSRTKSPTAPTRSFDADELAKAREGAPVTIGGVVYHPVRKTTSVMRDVRAIGRDQAKASRAATRLDRESDAAFDDGDDERGDDLARQSDEKSDAATDCTFEMLARLVVDEDDAQPDPSALQDHLDLTDAEKLTGFLMGVDEDEPDPTPPTPSSTT